MRAVNKKACKVLDILTEGLTEIGQAKDIDNSNGTFMKLHVEHVGECDLGVLFAVSHTFVQNGDLMRDPEMVFFRSVMFPDSYYPVSFQQDPGYYQEAVIFDENGKATGVDTRAQKDQAVFAGQWMENARLQQSL